MSHRKRAFDFAALEVKRGLILRSRPAFLVAVDERFISRIIHGIAATVGRCGGSQQAEVFILAVDGATSAILLDESDGEEFAFSGADQGAEVSVHVFCVCWLCFSYGESLCHFAGAVKNFFELFKRIGCLLTTNQNRSEFFIRDSKSQYI